MAEDLKFELAILATVQGFYQKLMRDSLGGDVPIPSGLDEVSLRHSDEDLPETLSRMYRWLHLLDMAITPAMLRQALTPDTDSEVAEALLRYFVRRREPSEVNRDRHVRIYGGGSGNAQDWHLLLAWQKDRWPMGLFQYGNAVMPDGNNTARFLALTTVAVRSDDMVTSLYSVAP